MQKRDLIALATRSFRFRRSRSFLTVLGVSIGIGTILFLVSLGYGLQNTLLKQISTSEALLSLDIEGVAGDIFKLNQEAISKIENITGIEEVSTLSLVPGQTTYNEANADAAVNIIKPSFFRMAAIHIMEGELFSDGDHNVVATSALARTFGITPAELVGKEIKLTIYVPLEYIIEDQKELEEKILELGSNVQIIKYDEPFLVKGVVEQEDAAALYVSKTLVDNANNKINNFSQIKVKVVNDTFIDGARTALIEKGFLVSAVSDTIAEAKKIFGIIRFVLAGFGIIALVVSAIGMINTLTITLLERTQEIGIMRAIGASKKDIWKLFLAEAILMGALGGLGGVIIGIFAGELFNAGINTLASALGGRSIDIVSTPIWFIFMIILISTGVGVFTGLYPSRRAAKLNPLEALRYK